LSHHSTQLQIDRSTTRAGRESPPDQLAPSLHRERHPVANLELVQTHQEVDFLVVSTQLNFSRSHVIEYLAPFSRSCHSRQNQLQILYPPQGTSVEHQHGTVEVRRLIGHRSRLKHDAQIDILRAESSERIVHLVAGILRDLVRSALDHVVVVVGIAQTHPLDPQDQLQIGQVEELTVVVFGGGPHENIQISLVHEFGLNFNNLDVASGQNWELYRWSSPSPLDSKSTPFLRWCCTGPETRAIKPSVAGPPWSSGRATRAASCPRRTVVAMGPEMGPKFSQNLPVL
jgi:hypothetical protein